MYKIERGKTNVGFGEYLKALRLSKGVGQDKLAKISGVSSATVWLIETGKTKNPRIETINSLLTALGVNEVDDKIRGIIESQSQRFNDAVQAPALPSKTPGTVRDESAELMNTLLDLIINNIKEYNTDGLQETKDYTEFVYKKMEKVIEQERSAYEFSIRRDGEKYIVNIEEVLSTHDVSIKSLNHALRTKPFTNLRNEDGLFYVQLLDSVWIIEKQGNMIRFKSNLKAA